MTTLKPGQIVRHQKYGNGIYFNPAPIEAPALPYVIYNTHGEPARTHDLHGWEPAYGCTEEECLLLEAFAAAKVDGHGHEIGGIYFVGADAHHRAEIVKPGHVQVRVDDLHETTHFRNILNLRAQTAWYRWIRQQRPAQPDEPQEFGARVAVTTPDGRIEKWLRADPDTDEAWRANIGSAIGYFSAVTWDQVAERGTVAIGWGDEQ